MNLKPLAVLLVLTLPLAACGNKGPLVRPSHAPPIDSTSPLPAPPPETGTTPPANDTAPPADKTPAETPPPDTTTPANPPADSHG
jgi:hypothetical protein